MLHTHVTLEKKIKENKTAFKLQCDERKLIKTGIAEIKQKGRYPQGHS